jgi:WD40 repeat protein
MKYFLLRALLGMSLILVSTASLRATAQTASNWTRTIAWSPDGTKIATGKQDGTIQIWNAATGQLSLTLRQGGPGPVETLVWKPGDSSKLASGGYDQPIVIWNVTTGQPLLSIGELPFIYTSIAWSPDGTKLVGVNDGGIFQIWDTATGQLLTSVPPFNFFYAVAWSPDGTKIATGRYDKIILWSPTGQQLATLQDNGREVLSVAWSPDGTKIASANVSGIVRTWNASTNQVIQTFSGHTDIVYSVAWSPDGTKIASASGDKTIRIWDTATGQTIRVDQSSDRVYAVAWDPDGSDLAYSSPTTTVQIVPASTTLKLQYYPDPSTAGNIVDGIMPDFNIVNTGSSAVSLTELKIRYYFTGDSSNPNITYRFLCSYTDLPGGCASGTTLVQGIVVKLSTPVTGADAYLEISFTGGTVAANSQTNEILAYVNKTDWSDFNQSNDYSFQSRPKLFTDWNKVTLYRNGVLVWGIAPS